MLLTMKHTCINVKKFQSNVYAAAANLASGPVVITNNGDPMWILQSATSTLANSSGVGGVSMSVSNETKELINSLGHKHDQ